MAQTPINGSQLDNTTVDAATLGGLSVGSGASQIVQRDGSGNNAADLLGGQPIGVAANNVLALNGSSQIPAVNGSLVTNVDAITLSGSPVGVLANNIVQLDGLARLPTVDGSQLTNLPSSTFRGALAIPTIDQVIATGVPTILVFASELYDTDAIHDNVTNNSRLTVPAGVSRVRLTGTIRQAGNAGTGSRNISILRNGVTSVSPRIQLIDTPPATANFTQHLPGVVMDVTPGDYFEINIIQSTGANLTVSNLWTFFGMEIIE